ncbi:MAG: hypothetical protein ACLU30_15855 [Odoribacter splanchnicus]
MQEADRFYLYDKRVNSAPCYITLIGRPTNGTPVEVPVIFHLLTQKIKIFSRV